MHRKSTPPTPGPKKRRSTKTSESKSASISATSRQDDAVEPLSFEWSFPVPFPEGEQKAVYELTVHPDVVRHILTKRLAKLHALPPPGRVDPLAELHAKLAMNEGQSAATYTAASLEAAMDWPLTVYMGLVFEAVQVFLDMAALAGSHRAYVATFGHSPGKRKRIATEILQTVAALVDGFARDLKNLFVINQRVRLGRPSEIDRDIE